MRFIGFLGYLWKRKYSAWWCAAWFFSPASGASFERVFSIGKCISWKRRSRLSDQALNSRVHSRMNRKQFCGMGNGGELGLVSKVKRGGGEDSGGEKRRCFRRRAALLQKTRRYIRTPLLTEKITPNTSNPCRSHLSPGDLPSFRWVE